MKYTFEGMHHGRIGKALQWQKTCILSMTVNQGKCIKLCSFHTQSMQKCVPRCQVIWCILGGLHSLAQPDWVTGLYKVSKGSLHDRTHLSSVVPLSHIHWSIHLFPKFVPLAPSSWSNSTVLDQCVVFYLNPFSDQNLYAELCL